MSEPISIPQLSLVVLIGASGSGKSTFARRHFAPTEILSSDACRAMISDDENDQSVTREAFDLLHTIAAKRLQLGRLTVIDATNVRAEDRRHYVEIARTYHCMPVALVLDVPERVCRERTAARPDRQFGGHVVARQCQALHRGLRGLKREGFRYITVLRSADEIEAVRIERQPTWTDRRDERGPFDIIGDVHGCFDELTALLDALGYRVERDGNNGAQRFEVSHPEKRKLVFLGDLVDRGPRTPEVLRLAIDAVRAGRALWVPGNHDVKLARKLAGRDVRITHGLAESLQQLEGEPAAFTADAAEFIDGLVSHFVLDHGNLVVAHAGMRENMQGRASGKVRDFALYGETTGETDEFGLPVRYPWAEEYRGRALVVYGHTPVPEPEWLNNTVNVDTGCVFGGRLSALRYPEREIVSVPAAHTYYEAARPFLPPDHEAPPRSAQQLSDDILDLEDVLGKRLIQTRLGPAVTIREGQASAALEVMTRFAVDPHWVIYLPPTMSPCETSTRPGLLEHPADAFAYFRSRGVPSVVCEEKHMGSRAVVVVCRDEAAARERFGVGGDAVGACFTRTGRRFFGDPAMERELLDTIRLAAEAGGMWTALDSSWLCLDAELMPWSAKAEELVRSQYAAVGASARAATTEALSVLSDAQARGIPVDWLVARMHERAALTSRYADAYRRYCWPVRGVADLKLAIFHVLASEGRVHADTDHRWHLEQAGTLAGVATPLLITTPHRFVDLTNPTEIEEATGWWEALTAAGGEGMVVKPLDFIPPGRGRVQPAIKVRGREYLRIIYGPEYTLPEHLDRLRDRGLRAKRSLAMQEFALGIEALERFVRREPLRRVHECVFGVLALESEAIDPRL